MLTTKSGLQLKSSLTLFVRKHTTTNPIFGFERRHKQTLLSTTIWLNHWISLLPRMCFYTFSHGCCELLASSKSCTAPRSSLWCLCNLGLEGSEEFVKSVNCPNHNEWDIIWPNYNISPTWISLKEGDFPSLATFWDEVLWRCYDLTRYNWIFSMMYSQFTVIFFKDHAISSVFVGLYHGLLYLLLPTRHLSNRISLWGKHTDDVGSFLDNLDMDWTCLDAPATCAVLVKTAHFLRNQARYTFPETNTFRSISEALAKNKRANPVAIGICWV